VRRDVPAYVVSASPRAMVVRGVAPLGIAPERVLAMTPVVEAGVIAPRIAPPMTYAHGKVEALEARVPGRTLLGTFGDNAFDLELLSRARVPVAVRPKEALLARASELPSLVRLAPIA
jgi:phosphoserine phosphatase